MQKQKRKRKTIIGGQALIEGLMMKGPEKTCTAVRKPDGSIFIDIVNTKKNPVRKIPFVRGVFAMIQNLTEGYSHITKSADMAFPDQQEDEGRFDKWVREKLGDKAGQVIGAIGMVLGVGLALVLFMFLPSLFTNVISNTLNLGAFKAVVEGVIKIFIFIGYLFTVTRMKEIHRVFEYHGAEHKTITCYEYGDELTVENVRKHSRFHPRCGTSFIFIVLIVSIIIFSLISWEDTSWKGMLIRTGLKILALPFVMGISYEVIMFAGKHDNIFCRILSAPGMLVQRLTAFEPGDDQIEVGITAFKAVLPPDEHGIEENTIAENSTAVRDGETAGNVTAAEEKTGTEDGNGGI